MFSRPLAGIIATNRGFVMDSYNAAKSKNARAFMQGVTSATSEYIFGNQQADAHRVVSEFYENDCRVVSITKKTKVGMDGLMIQIATLMTTHSDDEFVIDPDNVRFLTGMSNAAWETEMKNKVPDCFSNSVFHHGQLKHADLQNLRNALIIIDEIDTGDKIDGVLDKQLGIAGLLDIDYMVEHNIRFVFVSATMIKQLHELKGWGKHHATIQMTIPEQYIGHKEFLQREIIQEFYSLNTTDKAEKWVEEDIIKNYRNLDGTNDCRVHMVRVNNKTIGTVKAACDKFGVICVEHTSVDRLTKADEELYFEKPIHTHVVLLVKGLFRRANLIPNKWKLRIGAMHELHTNKVDNNVQIQGFPGRMSGYWADVIQGGHKTGPYRTSIDAVKEYEKSFEDPFAKAKYKCAGFSKNKRGVVTVTGDSMVSANNIDGLDPVVVEDENVINPDSYRVYDDEKTVKNVCKVLGYSYTKPSINEDGFAETSLNRKKEVVTLKQAIEKVPTAYGTNKGGVTWRTYYPCYVDTTDKATLRFVVIIRPGTDIKMVEEVDVRFPQVKTDM